MAVGLGMGLIGAANTAWGDGRDGARVVDAVVGVAGYQRAQLKPGLVASPGARPPVV